MKRSRLLLEGCCSCSDDGDDALISEQISLGESIEDATIGLLHKCD
jgi:hypothetical protein